MMRWCCLLLAALALGACKREVRELRTDPPAADALNDVAPMANRINGSLPRILVAEGSPYETNAYQLS